MRIKETDFETWNPLAFKLENGLIKLIKSLQEKMTQFIEPIQFLRLV